MSGFDFSASRQRGHLDHSYLATNAPGELNMERRYRAVRRYRRCCQPLRCVSGNAYLNLRVDYPPSRGRLHEFRYTFPAGI